jgi:hypothetical protein
MMSTVESGSACSRSGEILEEPAKPKPVVKSKRARVREHSLQAPRLGWWKLRLFPFLNRLAIIKVLLRIAE